jgi:hypothetical protein
MRRLRHLAGVLALVRAAASQDLPYNPTRAFLAPNGSSVYVFQPAAGSSTQSQLVSIGLTKPINSSDATFTTITQGLSFLQSDVLVPYTPFLHSNGNITVVAGNCSLGANGTEIWRFSTGGSRDSNGNWTQYHASQQGQGSGTTLGGSNFLANGMAFSQYVQSDGTDTDVFVFGGMCPYANSTADTWTASAQYSDLMVQVSPDTSQPGSDEFNLSLVAARGPPIAEAGFSVTPLTPTYSANISGTPQTQQQDFVLLGGHTQSAFINMSQVALFSLPQESWTFLPVSQPSGAKTDLTARDSSNIVTPRSGHSAVLSEDGTSIIIFGGWVGDVTNPADPQLAVLEFSGYGSDSDWSWSIPTQSGSGPASGSGLYGHGAVMLPGNVMMIMGGYTIPASSSSRVKRDSQTPNGQNYLYNATSNTWLQSYTPPASVAAQASDHSSGGALTRTSQQVGLGAGLGIGAAILVSLVAFYFWYSKRLKRVREERTRALLSRSFDGSFLGNVEQPFLSDAGIDGRGGDTAGVGRFWNVWDQSTGTYPQRATEMRESNAAGSTGLFVEVPSPTRGLRKGVASKNYQYHPAPRYDDKGLSRGSGNIHPIAEREDEDAQSMRRPGSRADDLTEAEQKLREVERVLTSEDPFATGKPNPLGSHPVSPDLDVWPGDTVRRVPTGASRISTHPNRQSGKGRAEEPNWVEDREPGEHLLIDTGRVSPTKTDERTSSTLSERSQHSTTSSNSITRTMSTRTGAMLAAAMAVRDHANGSPEHSSSSESRSQTMSTSGGRKSPFSYQARARSSTNGSAHAGAPRSAGTDADSFMTAQSNFVELQHQGEALLGSRPVMDRDDPYHRAMAAHSSTRASAALAVYENGAAPLVPPRRRQGWMGSLRRALVYMGDRSLSLTGTSERYTDDPNASSSSPIKERRIPRRAVSDGGALLRQKRGQKDWEDGQWPRYRDDPDPGDWGEPGRSSFEKQQAEEDWDVEGAAEKRDVQIMFTVPKAKLRVVNADMDRASLRSASDGALSRSGSTQTIRRERSLNTTRARSEGDGLLLPSTVEELEPVEGAARDERDMGS